MESISKTIESGLRIGVFSNVGMQIGWHCDMHDYFDFWYHFAEDFRWNIYDNINNNIEKCIKEQK